MPMLSYDEDAGVIYLFCEVCAFEENLGVECAVQQVSEADERHAQREVPS